MNTMEMVARHYDTGMCIECGKPLDNNNIRWKYICNHCRVEKGLTHIGDMENYLLCKAIREMEL